MIILPVQGHNRSSSPPTLKRQCWGWVQFLGVTYMVHRTSSVAEKLPARAAAGDGAALKIAAASRPVPPSALGGTTVWDSSTDPFSIDCMLTSVAFKRAILIQQTKRRTPAHLFGRHRPRRPHTKRARRRPSGRALAFRLVCKLLPSREESWSVFPTRLVARQKLRK